MKHLSRNTYFMFMSCNAETDCFLFPVLPKKISMSDSIKNTSVTISNFGETTIIENPGADTISFSSFFPVVKDQCVVVDTLYEPIWYLNKIEKWRTLKKPVHFILASASDIDNYYTIEDFTYSEEGGAVGEISFSIKLKLYREPVVRKIDLSENGQATVTTETKRVDNTAQSTTYTVVSGDSLYKIAKAKLSDGSKWQEIYNLNKDIIKNPNLIYPGQVLKLPKAGD